MECEICNQKFGSEIALSMHSKDKHGITNPEETARILKKADSTSYKLLSSIRGRKKLIIFVFATTVIILLIYVLILKPSTPNTDNITGGMMASMMNNS